MVSDLGRIQNPVTRALVTAAASFTIATIGYVSLLGLAKPSNQSAAYRTGLYVSLIATGGGAVLGLLYKPKASDRPRTAESTAIASPDGQWNDWRDFVVIRKSQESEEITSFYLKPVDGGSIPVPLPGQFLTIKLDIPGQRRPVIRTYSLSDYMESPEYYRLSIKREVAPPGSDVPPGVASNFMHDSVQEGTIIPAKPPMGKFFLDIHRSLPAVLISNGVGITPMISMAKAVCRANPERPVWFIHGARDSRFHAFREEVEAIAQQFPNLRVHFCYSRPRPEDAGLYHSTGYVDPALIQELVLSDLQMRSSSTDAEYFLCGSSSFMDALRQGFKEWDVPDERVFFESFGAVAKAIATPETRENGTIQQAEITFAKSGQTFTWQPDDGTILEFAEANGLNPPYSCRAGICLTCMCRIESGEVAYEIPPTGTPDEGSVLICISKPKTSSVVLDV